MGVFTREVRTFICDRCGEERTVEGAEPNPPGWQRVVISESTTVLCVECMTWLRRFLEGRKVAD